MGIRVGWDIASKESPYLVSYLNFYSWLLVFPFRIKYCQKTAAFTAVSSNLRKVLCFFSHFLILVAIFLSAYPTLDEFFRGKITILNLIAVTFQLSTLMATFLLLQISWFRKEGIADLCNLTCTIPTSKKSWKLKLKGFLTSIVSSVPMAMYICRGLFTYQKLFHTIKVNKFLTSAFTLIVDAIGIGSVSWIKSFWYSEAMKWIALLSFNGFGAVSILPFTLFLTLAQTMNHLGSSGLLKTVKNDWNQNVTQVILEYDKFKAASERLKGVFSGFLTAYYILAVVYFTQLPQILMERKLNTLNLLFTGIILAIISVSLYLALKANEKVSEAMHKFLQNSHRSLEVNFSKSIGPDFNFKGLEKRLQLLAVGQDVEASPSGISCWFFTITKGFVRSTFAVIVAMIMVVIHESNCVSTCEAGKGADSGPDMGSLLQMMLAEQGN